METVVVSKQPPLLSSPTFLSNHCNYVEQFFAATDGRELMTFGEFMKATGCCNDLLGKKLFAAAEADSCGEISLGAFLQTLNRLLNPDINERTAFVFNLFDVDADGSISNAELKSILSVCTDGMQSENATNQLAESFIKLCDSDATSTIQYAEFHRVVTLYPDLLKGLTFSSIGLANVACSRSPPAKKKRFRWIRKMMSWIVNNPQLLWTYLLTTLILIGCFVWQFLRYGGDCNGVDLDVKDPITGYSRHDLLRLTNGSIPMDISEEEINYVVFNKAMANNDPMECIDARRRKYYGLSLPIAKGSGQALKAILTLILFPVSRSLMTKLRETNLRLFFHFDSAIQFHKFLGVVGFLFAWIHTIAHIANSAHAVDPARFRYWSWAFPQERRVEEMEGVMRDVNGDPMMDDQERVVFESESRDGLPLIFLNDDSQPTVIEIVTSTVFVTGLILTVIYTIAALFAMDYPRKLSLLTRTMRPNSHFTEKVFARLGKSLNDFNNFWYTHHLFVVFYAVLVFHPLPSLPNDREEWGQSDTWAWVAVPVVIYTLERVARIRRGSRNTKIVSAELLPGNVVGLKFLRPKGFRYIPGQYVFIRCPQISPFEWHPFTLTTSPGDPCLGVSVRKAGDWTSALHDIVTVHHRDRCTRVSQSSAGSPSMSDFSVVDIDTIDNIDVFNFSISVDGAFGAPAQNYSDYRVVVLVGAGIGVTPFASVLSDLLDSLKQCACPSCGRSNTRLMRTKLRKVYFYWTIRSPSEATWFRTLLDDISSRDVDGILDINIHITGMSGVTDLQSLLSTLNQFTLPSTKQSTRLVTRFGRIEWERIFDKVQTEFPKEPNVGVFFCGPNTIAKILSKLCRMKSKETTTKFSFAQESFG